MHDAKYRTLDHSKHYATRHEQKDFETRVRVCNPKKKYNANVTKKNLFASGVKRRNSVSWSHDQRHDNVNTI